MHMNTNTLPLKPYHLPQEPSIWPLAPGWWLMAILLITLLTLAIYYWRKRRQQYLRDYRPEAKQLFHKYLIDFNADNQQLAMHINALLKRIALHTLGQRAARLTDAQWLAFLDQALPSPEKLADEHTLLFLTQQPYSAKPLLSEEQLTHTVKKIRYWLEKHEAVQPC